MNCIFFMIINDISQYQRERCFPDEIHVVPRRAETARERRRGAAKIQRTTYISTSSQTSVLSSADAKEKMHELAAKQSVQKK